LGRQPAGGRGSRGRRRRGCALSRGRLGSLLPQEHGAWGVLLVPSVIGVALFPSWAGLALCVAAVSTFLLRTVVLRALRGAPGAATAPAGLLCAAMAAAGGVPLLASGRWGLLALLAAAAGVVVLEARWPAGRGRARLLRELAEVAVLTALAPAFDYVRAGRLTRTGEAAWILAALYFSWTTADVRLRIARFQDARRHGDGAEVAARRRERAWTGAMAAAGAAAALGSGIVAPGAFAALAPLALRPLRRSPDAAASPRFIRRLGWQEVAWSLVFAAAAIAALRWTGPSA
jgi:hypothetical protein